MPEETWAATFVHIGDGTQVPVDRAGRRAAGTRRDRGRADRLAGAVARRRAQPTCWLYPYGCFEQRTVQGGRARRSRRLVAADERSADLCRATTACCVTGRAAPRPGSIALTAYALSITADAGLPWPADAKAKLLDALRGVVDGRVTEDGQGPADARFLKLAALAALARNGAATPEMIGQVAIPLGRHADRDARRLDRHARQDARRRSARTRRRRSRAARPHRL